MVAQTETTRNPRVCITKAQASQPIRRELVLSDPEHNLGAFSCWGSHTTKQVRSRQARLVHEKNGQSGNSPHMPVAAAMSEPGITPARATSLVGQCTAAAATHSRCCQSVLTHRCQCAGHQLPRNACSACLPLHCIQSSEQTICVQKPHAAHNKCTCTTHPGFVSHRHRRQTQCVLVLSAHL